MSVRHVTPDRLQIQEGGGGFSVFGLPFFAAGVFLFLVVVGVVPMNNGDETPTFMWPLSVVMAIAFTTVGGALVFGRSWMTIDRAQREVVKQWGLLVPLRGHSVPLEGYTAVTLGFVPGDSDSAESFPLTLKARIGPDLRLCSLSQYAKARAYATAIAVHLHLSVEDASTDHPITLTPSDIDLGLLQRARPDATMHSDAARPANARTEVTREMGKVTMVIPFRRQHPLVLATTLIPIGILLTVAPALATFFRASNTPDAVGWAFLGFLAVLFGILPMTTILGAFLRSRRGGTIVEVSKQGLRVLERGALTTRTVMAADAADILDVNYSSRESSLASAKRAAEQQALQAYPSAAPTVTSRVDRIVVKLARFAKGKGITVKTRTGLTTFGEGLDDAEVRYLHSIVRRTLIE